MKLASLKDGSRDGRLVVVSRDLQKATRAPAPDLTLLSAIENWDFSSARLRRIYHVLSSSNPGAVSAEVLEFKKLRLSAPLPRGPQWLDASAFHSHGNLMERVFGGVPSKEKLQTPLMYQGASDDFLGLNDDMPLPSEDDGIDFEAEIAVMVDNVPLRTPADAALSHVKLLLLVNDASLRAFAGRQLQQRLRLHSGKALDKLRPCGRQP